MKYACALACVEKSLQLTPPMWEIAVGGADADAEMDTAQTHAASRTTHTAAESPRILTT